MLCTMGKEVRVAVEYIPQMIESKDLPGPSEEKLDDVSISIPPIKTQLVGESLDLGTTKLNTIAKNLGHVTIDFS